MSDCSKFKRELVFQPMNIKTILNAKISWYILSKVDNFTYSVIRYSKYEEIKLLLNINNWKRGAFYSD